MRARLNSLLLATAWLVGAGCASKPVEPPATASIEAACANAPGNSLHLTSTTLVKAADRDAATDSVLTQSTSDPRLAQINARMYLTLRSLDAELHREQTLAACGQQSTLQAQVGNQAAAAAGGAADSAPAVAAAPTSVPVASNAVAGIGNTRNLRKTSLSPSSGGGGGNGATAPKIVPGSDNDVVASRLRKAAQQETNPSLRSKLWKEYIDYRQGTAAK
jgi:hypothetical protein